MIICQKLNRGNTINSLTEWFEKCPPAKGIKQWVDGRSAKETARCWLASQPDAPLEFIKTINSSASFSGFNPNIASPEFESHFDNFGHGRQHDMLIIGTINSENVIVGVEAKVDEEFGKTIQNTYQGVVVKRLKNKSTNAPERIEGLIKALFDQSYYKKAFKLRYQLLHSIAGTLSEALKHKADKCIFLVQTIISSKLDEEKYLTNQKDLDNFFKVFTLGSYPKMVKEKLYGPFRVPGNDFVPSDVDLYMGKYETKAHP